MKKAKGIEINPEIMFGKPVFEGTRVPVEVILAKLEAGQTTKEILTDYPRLTEQDIRVAVNYADKLM